VDSSATVTTKPPPADATRPVTTSGMPLRWATSRATAGVTGVPGSRRMRWSAIPTAPGETTRIADERSSAVRIPCVSDSPSAGSPLPTEKSASSSAALSRTWPLATSDAAGPRPNWRSPMAPATSSATAATAMPPARCARRQVAYGLALRARPAMVVCVSVPPGVQVGVASCARRAARLTHQVANTTGNPSAAAPVAHATVKSGSPIPTTAARART
jgi:hypothetical protein